MKSKNYNCLLARYRVYELPVLIRKFCSYNRLKSWQKTILFFLDVTILLILRITIIDNYNSCAIAFFPSRKHNPFSTYRVYIAMIFLFTAINQQQEVNSFSYRIDKLEKGLDFINRVVAKGEIILSVHLFDHDGVIDLPAEVFDGSCFTDHLQQLELDWQVLLEESGTYAVDDYQEQIKWAIKSINLYETKIANHTSIVDRFESLLQRAKNRITGEPGKSMLLDYYSCQIDLYKYQLYELGIKKDTVVKRLNVLINS